MADKVITPANVVFSSGAKYVDGLSGEAISIMQPVYLDQSVTPNVFRLARATTAILSNAFGVAMQTVGAANQRLLVCWYDPDLTPGFNALAAGEIICVSAALGANAPSTDLIAANYVCILGIGKLASKMVFGYIHRSPDPK